MNSQNLCMIVVAGASGRMGQAIIRVIHDMPGAKLVGALERKGADTIGRDAGEIAGVGSSGVIITDNQDDAIKCADAIIDFTTPETSVAFSKVAAEHGLIHVIGTTGCSQEQDAEIAEAGSNGRIVKSGNMSLGVNLLSVLVEQAAKALGGDDWDLEILEMHHKHKVDAPSGTAYLLGEAAAKGRDIDLHSNSVRSRDGVTGARGDGTIGFATLRGGSVVGEHSVIIAGEGEQITLSHSALDRSIFARGAVKAALWAQSQNPGYYSMLDVLGLSKT
ncbi:MAG: 4-hydroxy-tetrahydrodipicolinate reductase [Rhizobiaceae bacterium]|nr:4-hydroxy-tetrahydrodipicolinate reductase [Rhizobiaceae bacterium]